MKNQILTTIIAIALCMVCGTSQAQTTLYYSSPDTLRACDVNRFSVSLVNPVTDTIIITPQLNFPSGTAASCTTNNNGVNYIFESVTGGTASTLQTGNTLRFVLNGTGTVTYTYRAEIDCHVIMIDSAAGLVKLQQDFTGSNTYVIHPGNSNSTEQVVNYTKLTELNAGNNFYVNYQQDTTWLFYYKNTLSHRTNIGFTFNVNTALPCTGLLFDPVIRFSNGLHGQSFVYSNNPAADTILLNASDTLVIRVKVKATDCVSCSGMAAAWSYRCNQSQSGCNICEHSFIHAYTANMNDKPKIDVLRLTPQQAIYDNSCINDTSQTTLWSYNIVNTGNCAIDSIQFDLTQLGDAAWDVRRLMLMPRKSLVIEKTTMSHCTIDTVMELKSQHLCVDLVDTAVYSCYTKITDFFPGDTVQIRFALLRCSEDTAVLMNAYKYYNAWMFKNLKTKSICGVEQFVPTASGFAAGTLLAGQAGGGGYDVHLQHQFYPSVSDMSVSNSGTGEKATFNVRLLSMLNNGKSYVYQLLGCNQPQPQCTTLNGWLRATVVCDTNLTIPNAYSDAFMITLSATGDTTFYKPYYYNITQDSLSCQAKKYHYYFNLADSGMRTVIDSGRFVYTLQACCNSDTDPTPYKAEFHLLADAGNCFTINLPSASVFHYQEPTFSATDGIAQWLPLSHAGNTISVHCPGCVIPGIIVDHYRMERNTYGLQDSDNDHRADSATAVIDTGSVWFAQNKNNLSSTTLAFGDRCTDYLRAHVQPGDPGNDGYSYAQIKQLGLRLNALQLSRIMPLALDTMMVVPDTLTFYIDDPTDSIGGCLECEPFGAGNDDFITLLKIVVTGTDIAQFFLNTNTNLNEYLYSFTSFFDSTAVSDTGNLHNTTWHIPTGSSRSFHGFEEGQSIRLKVSYHVCGNFNPPGDLTPENTFRQSHIQNTVWLSGKRQQHSQVPQMEQSLTLLQNSMNITIYDTLSPPYNLMDTSYVNNRLFFCETRGNFAYFAATTFRNKTIITNKNNFQCLKRMEINMSSGYCNNALLYDAYPFEYRSPLMAGQSVAVNVPPGYEIVQATSKHKVPIGNNFYQTLPVDITALLPNTTGNISLNTTPFIAAHCLTHDTTAQNVTTGTTAYMGDQFYEHTITLDMMPVSCTDDTAHNNSSSTVVTFGNQAAPCQSFYGCQNTTTTMTNASNTIEDFTLGANLMATGIGNSLATGISDTVCWNNLVLINTTKDNADHVFLSVANAPAYLSQWHYISHPSGIITQANGHVIGLTPTLAQNILLSGNVCAVMDSCPPLQDTLQFYLHYGWNCKNYPGTPFTVDSVCFTDSMPLRFTRAAYELVTASWSQTNSFSLCDTLFAEAKFQNGKAGFVYPFMVTLPSYDPRLQIIVAMACSNTDTVGLTPTAAPDVWTLTTDSLMAMLGSTGIHNSQYVTIRFLMVASCGFGMNVSDMLPAIQMAALSICNDTLTATSRQLGFAMPAFAWDSTSHCPDCWSITKTASTDTVAAVTDTVTYTITVCNNSVNTQTGTLADNTPANFMITNSTLPATITLNSMQCDTFTVSGYFTSPGSCFYNVASVTSPAGTTWKDSVCVSVNYACTDSSTFIIYDSTYSTTLNYRYDTLNLFVEGTLFVNDTLKLMRCNVYMNAGAHIIVQAGGYLDIDSSLVMGCTNMWRGITVLDYGEIIVHEGSTVADADTTILANNKAKATLQNSYIKNFVLGVYMPPSANVYYNGTTLKVEQTTFDFTTFKPNYTGQNTHGVKPECGVLLNDWIGTIGGTLPLQLNSFNNLNTGIVSIGSIIIVKRSVFKNINYDTFYSTAYIGTAITSIKSSSHTGKLTILPEAWSYTTVDSSYRGIYTNGSELTATYLHLLNVRTGVEQMNAPMLSTNTVSNCTITASHIAIKMATNPFARFMYTTNNDITINGTSQGGSGLTLAHYGILMSEGNANTFVRYTASNNILKLNNALHGIYAGALNTAKIKYNMVKINGNGSGISVFANQRSSVNCNTVEGTFSSGITGNSMGYTIGNSNNKLTVSCNLADSTYRGFNFGGSNPSTLFKGNEMNIHYIGLYLNTGSPTNPTYIGIQPHHGNRWNTSSVSSFGGINLTSNPWVQASRFDVNPLSGSIYNPVVTPSSWFHQDTIGTTFDCGYSTICSTPPPAMADTTIRDLIELGIFDSDEISTEAKAIATEYIYKELADDSALWYSDSTYIQFMYENQSEPVAYLYDAEEYLRAAYTYDSTLMALFDSCNLQITTLTDSIEKLDENHPAGWEVIRDQVLYTIEFLNQKIYNLHLQREALFNDNLTNAELQNSYVVNGELPELNSAYMNEMEINYMETDEDLQFLRDNYSGIFAIASQCPYVGGKAVERARTYIALINDSISYDDANICLQSGVYRFANDTTENIKTTEIKIIPNPANDKVTIQLKGIDDGICKIQIRNVLNEIVYDDVFDCKNQKHIINVSNLSQGVYSITINAIGKKSIINKLFITR